jgi:hypothetical protein
MQDTAFQSLSSHLPLLGPFPPLYSISNINRLRYNAWSFISVISRISTSILFLLSLSIFGARASAHQNPSLSTTTMNENHSKQLFNSTSLRAEQLDQSVTSTTMGNASFDHENDNKENVQNAMGIHKTSKRNGYLSWDDYFLAVACLSSKRSKDPKAPSGACIVDEKNRIVGE